MIKKTLIVVIAAGLLISMGGVLLCGCSGIPEAGYVNKKYGFAFDPPQGWREEERSEFSKSIFDAMIDGFAEGAGLSKTFATIQKNIIVEFYRAESTFKSRDKGKITVVPFLVEKEQPVTEIFNDTLDKFESQSRDTDIEVKPSNFLRLQGVDALKIETYNASSEKYLTLAWFERQNKRSRLGFMLLCEVDEDEYYFVNDDFDKALNSVKLFRPRDTSRQELIARIIFLIFIAFMGFVAYWVKNHYVP